MKKEKKKQKRMNKRKRKTMITAGESNDEANDDGEKQQTGKLAPLLLLATLFHNIFFVK